MAEDSVVRAITLAAVPAAIALLAAYFSYRSARDARTSQEEVARLQRLEARVSAQKYEIYAPVLDTFGAILSRNSSKDGIDFAVFEKFQTWATIYASDAALRSFARYQQAVFDDAPSHIMLRLYSEFLLEARRELGDEATLATPSDMVVVKLKDLFTRDDMLAIFTLPFNELCENYDWAPPWTRNGGSTLATPLPTRRRRRWL